MLVIRNCCFETNSSSMHSISIRGKNKYDDIPTIPTSSEVIIVYPEEFGWSGPSCNDFDSKLTYAMQMVLCTEYPGTDYEDSMIDQDKLEECKGYQLLLNAIQDFVPNCKTIIIKKLRNDFHPYGYIDHQSYEDYHSLQDFLDDWGVDIKRYLFDSDVIIHIDNDNH